MDAAVRQRAGAPGGGRLSAPRAGDCGQQRAARSPTFGAVRRTGVDEVALLELDLFERGLLRWAEERGWREHLVDDADLAGEVVLDEVLDEVSADEADAAEHEEARLARHGAVTVRGGSW